MIWHIRDSKPIVRRIGDATCGWPVERMEFDVIDLEDMAEGARRDPERLALYLDTLQNRFVGSRPIRRP